MIPTVTPVSLSPKHDELFRKAMEKPIVAQEFFNTHLPQEIKNIIDIGSLFLQNSNFVEQDLKTRVSDLVFTAKTEKGDAYIYLLLEHQSTIDEWMSFRLFKYMISIGDRYRAENPNAKSLPLIYPMVFYNGKDKYKGARNLWTLFQDPELAKRFWNEDYTLVNMRETPNEEIKKHQGYGMMEFFMKHIRAKNILSKWKEIAPFLRDMEVTVGEGYIDLFLSYTLTSIKSHDKIMLRELLVQNLGKEKGESTMASLAQQWFDEGLYKGFDQGRLEGKLEGFDQGVNKGKLEGKLEAARNVLKQGLDIGMASKITGLPISKLKALLENSH